MDLISTVADALALRLLWTGSDSSLELSSEEPVVDPNSHGDNVDAN